MNTRMTARQMRQMVGSRVSYRGREAVIASVRPDMGMMELQLDSGGTAIIRPSELGSVVERGVWS